MKKAIIVSWLIFALSILAFVITVFTSDSDSTTWRVFSVAIPLAGASFCAAFIFTFIDHVRSKKK